MASMVASFEVPQVAANESGWGPTTVPEQLDGVPYAPFGKGDKIGRVSDFTAAGIRYGEQSSSKLINVCYMSFGRSHLHRSTRAPTL